MSKLNSILKSIDRLNDWVGRRICWLVVAIFALLLVEVIRRYVFNSPSVWANELTQMLFGAFVILSGGYVLRWDGHVSVDIVQAHLPKKARAVVDIVTSSLFFLFTGVLLYYGGSMAWDSLIGWEHSESAWNPPLYPIKLAIPLGALLLILQGLAKLVRDILTLVGRDIEAANENRDRES